MREHRDVSEHVVEAVRRLEIVELVAGADEIADREHAFRQHREEDVVGDQPGNGDRAPAGPRLEDRIEPFDIRDARVGQLEKVDSVEERRDHAAAEQLHLPGEQQIPHGVVLGSE